MSCRFNKQTLIVILGLFCTTVHYGEATKRQCIHSGAPTPDASAGSCKIRDFSITNTSQIETILAPYTNHTNIIIFGVSLPEAELMLNASGNLGNAERIRFDQSTYRIVLYSRALTVGAVHLAIENFCDANSLDFTFVIVSIDDKCDPDIGTTNSIQMLNVGFDAALGMPCGVVTRSAGLLLDHFNIPIMSMDSNFALLSNKNIYRSLIRVGFVHKRIGYVVTQVLKKYEWKKMSLITSDSEICESVGQYIEDALKDEKDYSLLDRDRVNSGLTEKELRRHLQRFKAKSRVIFICLNLPDIELLMKLAASEDMTTYEYVYIILDCYPSDYIFQPWNYVANLSTADQLIAVQRYAHVKIITVPVHTDPDERALMLEIAEIITQTPFNYTNYKEDLIIERSPNSLYLYDAVWIYLTILREAVQNNLDHKNGSLFIDKLKSRTFQGVSGEITLDAIGDRITNYFLWHLAPGDDAFTRIGTLDVTAGDGKVVVTDGEVYWGTPDGKPPSGKVGCSFWDFSCNAAGSITTITFFSVFAFVLLVLLILSQRKRIFEGSVKEMRWSIDCQDITTKADEQDRKFSDYSAATSGNDSMNSSLFSMPFAKQQIFTKIVYYKGNVCTIQQIRKTNCRLTRQDHIELKYVIEMTHLNLISFIGLCIDEPYMNILSGYCEKGSLEDFLQMDEINIDWVFKCSLIFDLANGLKYIHESPIKFHGALNSDCCGIDARWTLKIGRYGLKNIRFQHVSKRDDVGEYRILKEQLHVAPEFLRSDKFQSKMFGSQKGDIYSFALIVQEIMFREMPFYMYDLPIEVIIEKIRQVSEPPFRPAIPATEGATFEMVKLMKECWVENPEKRPSISDVKKKLITLNNNQPINLVENMLFKLEKYSNILEKIVKERSGDLLEEKEKSTQLVYRMLPYTWAKQLLYGNPRALVPEVFESVSVFASDVVEFTSLCTQCTPIQVVRLLNDMYMIFDAAISKYDAYKVETIGDAYLVVSGCPNRNGEAHASEIANLALDFRRVIDQFKIPHLPTTKLKMRIGLNSGICAAGILGVKCPKFVILGDAIIHANAMEATGEAMKIQVSGSCRDILVRTDTSLVLTCRGEVVVKGKGPCVTYWLEKAGKT